MNNIEALADIQDKKVEPKNSDKAQNQSQILLELCNEVQLFHTPEGEAYATFSVNGHLEHWPLKSRGFKGWLGKLFFEKRKSAPSAQAFQDALSTLEGRAQYDGPESEVFLRVARFSDQIYIDLGDPEWKAVEISSSGFSVVDQPPVKFRRPRGMLSLPYPQTVDPVERSQKFKKHINIESDEDFKLVMAFLMAAFLPEGPYPVLVPYGEQGTGKSTLVRLLRSVVDPNSSPLRREPRTADDLMISAKNNWILAFDNVSRLSDDMSDDICRLSTGGGLAKRELYTDDGEIVLNAKRPCILNGIEEFITRGDLADRSIVISLPMIPDERRAREEVFQKAFEEDRAGIFSAICTAISVGLRNKDTFELAKKPRLADAFHWASATEEAFGWERGSTVEAYFKNQQLANEIVLISSPLFKHIDRYASQAFRGTAQLLLQNIRSDADPSELKYLPANPISLGNKLRRLRPALKRAGIEVVNSRLATERIIELRKSVKSPVTVVTPVIPTRRYAPPNDNHDDSDNQFPMNSHRQDINAG